MEKLWTLEFGIFIVMAVGLLIRRNTAEKQDMEQFLTTLVLYVVLPCNIFNSFLNQLSDGMARDCVMVLAISIGIQLFSCLYGKLAFRNEAANRRCSLVFSMICSNAGFLGNPIAEGIFGSAGLMLASIYLIPQRIMMWTHGLAIYTNAPDRRTLLKKVITHPCIIACALGLIAMLTNTRPPEILMTPIEMIARCNTALSMLLLGMILAEIDLKALANWTIVRFTVHRLVLMPLAVYLVCRVLGFDQLVTGVSTLLAAMPAGATTSILALRYTQDTQFAARLVTFSTLCSIPSILIWSLILTR